MDPLTVRCWALLLGVGQVDWNQCEVAQLKREVAKLKEDLAAKDDLMDSMVSKDFHLRDLDYLVAQNRVVMV